FAILFILLIANNFYSASINNYLIFYLTQKFGISVQAAQIRLFLYMFALAAGTLLGGPLGDRVGRRYIIWFSILGAAPFTLMMPHLNLVWTSVILVITGLILSSAFAAIVVFAQELAPGHVGTIGGMFFGLSFGIGGIGAAVFGKTADIYGLDVVFKICSFLPLIGILAMFLPTDRKIQSVRAQ
ncbi:MAG: MFS transporter, partial [Synergistaceae bacterium]|nr:MFS transporter [Synergistaceae bacterium]